ncbi:hypothetical protein ACQKGO_07540 [Corallococcus interemptor]|uniref:hypothetical protein n=1 Tax=Corallococcus interemptor TaxID=2316720 RepID=UPI003D08EF53
MSTRTPTHDFTQADVDAIVARTPMSARETGRPAWGGWGGCWRRWASARLSLHGVDTLLHVLFFCLVFMPSAGRWSLDARAGRVSTGPTSGARVALRTLQLHLCFISLDTGLAKAQGVQWWNGEALWRALMQPRFQSFDFSWLASYPLLAKVGWWPRCCCTRASPYACGCGCSP